MKNLAFLLVAFLQVTAATAAPRRSVASTSGNTEFSTRNEVLVNYGAATGGVFGFGPATVFGVNGGYYYSVLPYLEIGGTVGIDYASRNSASATVFKLIPGARINLPFETAISDAFFAGAGIGFGTSSVSNVSASSMYFKVEAGKRFKLFPNVSYSPEAVLLIPTNGAFDVEVAIHFLSASILF